MGFSSKTKGPKWAEDGTYAVMPDFFLRFLQKVKGHSNYHAAAKLKNPRSTLSSFTPTNTNDHGVVTYSCDLVYIIFYRC